MFRRPTRLFALSLFALPTAAGGPVIVVDDDGGPGVDFTSLQAAADAAPEGAVLLVRDGTYAGLTLQAKSLQIAAEMGSAPAVGSIEVRDLLPGQELLLRGLRSDSALPAGGLVLANNQGFVWVEDCVLGIPTLAASLFGALPFEGAGVRAVDCAGVALLRCTLYGGYGLAATPVVGMPALSVEDASVWLYDCELTGATGFATSLGLSQSDPGAGALVDGGFLWASGSRFEGGKGADGDSVFGSCFPPAGPGGTGLHEVAGKVRLLDTELAGGAGGEGPFDFTTFSNCPDGPPGPDLVQDGGLFLEFAGSARSFSASTPESEGGQVALSYGGEPGDAVFLLLSFAQLHEFRPELTGTLLLPDPPAVSFAGTIGAGGTLQASVPVPDFGPGFQALTLYAQSIHLDTTGALVLGPGSAVVLLDAP